VNFDELNITKPLLNALNDLEYTNPTPIQKEGFPRIMSGVDVVGIAQTGTGKTFAYLLPLLRQLTYSDERYPRILIIVPTRELVVQVVGEIEKLTKYMNVRFAGVYGGTNINTQRQLVYDGLDVLVATPGRLLDLKLTGVLRLKLVKKLVIDEVDEMLNLGFRHQLVSIIENLSEKRQNLMFSATLTDDVEKLINDFFSTPAKIEIERHGTPIEKIKQIAYHVPNFFTKVNLLTYLLTNDESFSKVLIFVASKKLADKLHEQITEKFPSQIGVIHSNKSQNYRLRTLKEFDQDKLRVLISTDILARGLDITDVSHVINFDLPDFPVDYIHRIGRTGRKEKTGIALSFINEKEQEYQVEIEKLMNKIIKLKPLPEDLEISQIYTDEERPILYDKTYLKSNNFKDSQGAFHEKKEKNKKVNLGGSYRRKLSEKYNKPKKRSGKK
jgi:ATP-dependent RNA helicase RhlE